MDNEPKLMALSIPRGWAIGDNKFYDVDPVKIDDSESDFIENSLLGFIEDTLWLFEWSYQTDKSENEKLIIPQKRHYTINVGWRPDSNIKGQYHAKLYWDGENDRIEVDSFSSKDRFQIKDTVEKWMDEISTDYTQMHSKFL